MRHSDSVGCDIQITYDATLCISIALQLLPPPPPLCLNSLVLNVNQVATVQSKIIVRVSFATKYFYATKYLPSSEQSRAHFHPPPLAFQFS